MTDCDHCANLDRAVEADSTVLEGPNPEGLQEYREAHGHWPSCPEHQKLTPDQQLRAATLAADVAWGQATAAAEQAQMGWRCFHNTLKDLGACRESNREHRATADHRQTQVDNLKQLIREITGNLDQHRLALDAANAELAEARGALEQLRGETADG